MVDTPRNVVRVAAVIGAERTSLVSSVRRNSLMLSKSSCQYCPIRRKKLKPEDLPRRIQFCTWIFNQAKIANFKRSILPLF